MNLTHSREAAHQFVGIDEVVQFRITANDLDAYLLIRPSRDDFRSTAIYVAVCNERGTALGVHLSLLVQAVEKSVQLAVGGIIQLQHTVVGVFTVFRNDAVFTLYRNREGFGEDGGGVIDD